MENFKDYYENKKADEILEEGLASAVGHILGIGTAGVLSAWLAAMLFKGGVGAINSISQTLGKAKGIQFKKNFREMNSDSPAVKKELNEVEILKRKYEGEISEVLKNIKIKNWEEAGKEFRALNTDLRNSTEVKRVIISEIMKETKVAIIDTPTPGSESYQALRKIIDMQTAKVAAKATQEQIQKYIINREE